MATSACHLAIIPPPGLKIGPSRYGGEPWRGEIWAGGRQLQAFYVRVPVQSLPTFLRPRRRPLRQGRSAAPPPPGRC